MGILASLGRLFGGGSAEPAAPERGAAVEYKGCRIIPAPRSRGGQYVTAGLIEKEIDGVLKVHEFVRADTTASADEAKSFTVQKAQRLIDEQGDRLFD